MLQHCATLTFIEASSCKCFDSQGWAGYCLVIFFWLLQCLVSLGFAGFVWLILLDVLACSFPCYIILYRSISFHHHLTKICMHKFKMCAFTSFTNWTFNCKSGGFQWFSYDCFETAHLKGHFIGTIWSARRIRPCFHSECVSDGQVLPKTQLPTSARTVVQQCESSASHSVGFFWWHVHCFRQGPCVAHSCQQYCHIHCTGCRFTHGSWRYRNCVSRVSQGLRNLAKT